MLTLAFLACSRPAVPDSPDTGAPRTVEQAPPQVDTFETRTVTTTEPAPYDCADLPAGPLPFAILDLWTYEDFDFDADGNLITQLDGGVVARTMDNQVTVLGATDDARGIGVLSGNDVVLATITAGNIDRIHRDTGAVQHLAQGLSWPNGVDVGPDDVIYFSESSAGRIRILDPDGAWIETLADGLDTGLNGVVVAQDGSALWVAHGPTLTEFDHLPDGTWSVPKDVYVCPTGGAFLDNPDLDSCGNLYVADAKHGDVYRVDPRTGTGELLATLPPDTYSVMGFTAARFGDGRGGWLRDTLYVTSRHFVYAIPVGVPGKPPLFP